MKFFNFEQTEVIVEQHNEVGNFSNTVNADCHCCKLKFFVSFKTFSLYFIYVGQQTHGH